MNKKEIITINGSLGSGKSSTADLVAKELGFMRFSSGDFMRKINHELINMKKNKSAIEVAEIENKINEIQTYVQYYPNWNLTSTKEKLIGDVEELIHLEAIHSS